MTMKLKNWRFTRSGDAMTVEGRNAETELLTRVANITLVAVRGDQIFATHRDGTEFELVGPRGT